MRTKAPAVFHRPTTIDLVYCSGAVEGGRWVASPSHSFPHCHPPTHACRHPHASTSTHIHPHTPTFIYPHRHPPTQALTHPHTQAPTYILYIYACQGQDLDTGCTKLSRTWTRTGMGYNKTCVWHVAVEWCRLSFACGDGARKERQPGSTARESCGGEVLGAADSHGNTAWPT